MLNWKHIFDVPMGEFADIRDGKVEKFGGWGVECPTRFLKYVFERGVVGVYELVN